MSSTSKHSTDGGGLQGSAVPDVKIGNTGRGKDDLHETIASITIWGANEEVCFSLAITGL